jgi:hypothetical protein
VVVRGEHGEVRGTQSFVHTLSWCWRRPGLTGLEIAWRWAFGIPAVWIVWREAARIWGSVPVDVGALQRMTILNPMASAETIESAVNLLLQPALAVAWWLAPVLLVVWIIVSSVGRTVVLRRMGTAMGSPMRARPVTLILLQVLRLTALVGSFAAWFWCLRADAVLAVAGPIAEGREPNLVLLCAIAIAATLGMFVLWAIVSWVFSVAPLLAMLRGLGTGAALRAAATLGELKGKLVEINLVMGIVKIALVVLAMVFSACPLPFESIATPGFMERWYVGVGIWYVVASDFFHVVRLAAYLQLWKVYEAG